MAPQLSVRIATGQVQVPGHLRRFCHEIHPHVTNLETVRSIARLTSAAPAPRTWPRPTCRATGRTEPCTSIPASSRVALSSPRLKPARGTSSFSPADALLFDLTVLAYVAGARSGCHGRLVA
eukprot:363169-Chlamydomonas_euryale.AAC.49